MPGVAVSAVASTSLTIPRNIPSNGYFTLHKFTLHLLLSPHRKLYTIYLTQNYHLSFPAIIFVLYTRRFLKLHIKLVNPGKYF